MEEFVKPFKALSDETRLRIFNLLLQRECCVCEVMQVLEISQTRASRNLGILENAGFLKSHRDGAWVLYSLCSNAENKYADSFNAILKELADSDVLFQEDKERLKKTKRIGHGCTAKLSARRTVKSTKSAKY